MAIKLDKDKLARIDSEFTSIKHGNSHMGYGSYLKSIEDVLDDVFDMKFHIKIIKPKRNDPLYIMSVFPEESTIDKLVEAILNEDSDTTLKNIWSKNKNWTIEIDNRILTGSYIDANSKELTALLLHEVGHVVYSNSVPHRMAKIMRYEFAKASIGAKNVFKHGVFKDVLKIPILKACLLENYRTDPALKKELKADVFAVKAGYGDELDSVLKKMISYSSTNKDNAANINRESEDLYDKMKSDTLFSINLVEDLRKREAKVSRENFKKMLMDLPSDFVQKSLKKVDDTLFNPSKNKTLTEKEKVVTEGVCALYESAYTTEAFSVFKKKMKRIDPETIDYIIVKKSSMKSNDDKIMLISYIYSKIDLINYYLTLMNNPVDSRKYIFMNTQSELLRMRDALEKQRIEILNYKIPETHYGVQIIYPDGYTG